MTTDVDGLRLGSAGSPIRVLLVCDHIDHDGALHGVGRQLVKLVAAFDPARVQATLCVVRPASSLGIQLQKEGHPLHFLGVRPANPLAILKLGRIIRARRIQLVHLTDFGASTYGRIAARLTGIPAVVHVRSHHSPYQPKGFPRHVGWAYQVLAPLTDRAIAISMSVRDFATRKMGFRPDQIVVLNNPLALAESGLPPKERIVSLRSAHGLGEGDPVVGAVTRFHAAKGIASLIEAFALVLQEVRDARLVLVGQGPEEAALRSRAAALGIADRVVFAGFQRDVQAYFRLFTVSTVPSLEEGFGNVAVEAMSMGTPVVASRTGGLPEVVADGETGFLVEPGDAAGLARAIARILKDRELRERMARAAQESSRRFSMGEYVERLEEVYSSVLPRPGSGRRQ